LACGRGKYRGQKVSGISAEGRHNAVKAAAIASVAVLAACSALWPVAFAGRVPAYGDNISFWAPNTWFWMSELAAGRFPWWNPHILGGVPFAADINHGIFYPPNWILLTTDSATGLRLLVILHAALGIGGMYLFARSQEIDVPAALWAGVAFGLSEMFLPLSNHVVMLESMSWMGFALWLGARLVQNTAAKDAGLLALVLALSALAGDVHATYIIAIACGVVILGGMGGRLVGRRVREAFRVGALGISGLAGGALLGAVGLLPAAQFVMQSSRAQGDVGYAGYHSLDPKAAVGVFLPNFWGAVSEGSVWNFRADDAVFLGAVVIALAAYALRKPAKAAIPAALVVTGIVLSMGEWSPVWTAVREILPGFKVFRQPREYFIIGGAGFLILAAHTLQDISHSKAGGRRGLWKLGLAAGAIILCMGAWGVVLSKVGAGRVISLLGGGFEKAGKEVAQLMVFSCGRTLVVAGLVAAGVSLRKLGLVAGRSVAGAIAALVIVEYGMTSWGSIVFGPAQLCTGRGGVASHIREEARGGYVRIASEAEGFGEYFEAYGSRRLGGRLGGEKSDLPTLFKVKSCLVDNEGMYAALPSALGYSTFIPKRYAALWEAAGGRKASPVRLRATTGVNYGLLEVNFLLKASQNWDECRPYAIGAGGGIRMCYDWIPAASFDEARSALAVAQGRAAAAPVVEGAPATARKAGAAEVRHSVEAVRRGTSSVAVRVFTDAPGILYLAECNFPGWKAYDNGAEIPIYNANLAFKAVYLTAGRHDVEFRFRPKVFYLGAAITAAGAVVLLCLLFTFVRRGGHA